MAKLKLGKETYIFDIMDKDNAEKYEKALGKVQERVKENGTDTTLADTIEKACNVIAEFIDTLFGEGVHKSIFGETKNLREYIKIYRQIISEIETDIEKTSEEMEALAGAVK